MKTTRNSLLTIINVWLKKSMRLILHDVGDGYYFIAGSERIKTSYRKIIPPNYMPPLFFGEENR